jgi:hypothetical protein
MAMPRRANHHPASATFVPEWAKIPQDTDVVGMIVRPRAAADDDRVAEDDIGAENALIRSDGQRQNLAFASGLNDRVGRRDRHPYRQWWGLGEA